jgi:hypothetical protein
LADSPQRAGTNNPRDHKPCFFQKGGLGYEKDIVGNVDSVPHAYYWNISNACLCE